jgi:hypothetical protein
VRRAACGVWRVVCGVYPGFLEIQSSRSHVVPVHHSFQRTEDALIVAATGGCQLLIAAVQPRRARRMLLATTTARREFAAYGLQFFAFDGVALQQQRAMTLLARLLRVEPRLVTPIHRTCILIGHRAGLAHTARGGIDERVVLVACTLRGALLRALVFGHLCGACTHVVQSLRAGFVSRSGCGGVGAYLLFAFALLTLSRGASLLQKFDLLLHLAQSLVIAKNNTKKRASRAKVGGGVSVNENRRGGRTSAGGTSVRGVGTPLLALAGRLAGETFDCDCECDLTGERTALTSPARSDRVG